MTRNYLPDAVPADVVTLAVDNATRAPNAGFSQGWAFVVLDDAESVRRFWAATATDPQHPNTWLAGMMRAPVVVIPCSSKAAYLDRYAEPDKGWTDRAEARWSMPYWHLDAAMASLLILQTATDHGLGSCFFGIPTRREQQLRTAFDIPPTFDPIGAITIGHAAPRAGAQGSPSRRGRRALSEVTHRGGWTSEHAKAPTPADREQRR